MADTKATGLTENTAPLGGDVAYLVDDPTGTPASNKILLGNLNLLPDGFIVNGAISVTVASNNITVALKTKSGGNPSATDPVSIWLNGAFRRCTATLSVTKNAATNWFGSGGSMFATLERDYFVYLVWNTTPATDIVDIGFSPIPYGRVYSDFSSTTTAQNYLAYANGSAPTSTDNCTVIGRFAATLSAGAGYTWSVPTFTNVNLIQFPTYQTRPLSYTPSWVASGTAVSLGNGTITGKYFLDGRYLVWQVDQSMGSTTTYGTGTYKWSTPFTVTTHGIGSAMALDAGVAFHSGTVYALDTSNINIVSEGGSNVWSQTIPQTWASSDYLKFSGFGWL